MDFSSWLNPASLKLPPPNPCGLSSALRALPPPLSPSQPCPGLTPVPQQLASVCFINMLGRVAGNEGKERTTTEPGSSPEFPLPRLQVRTRQNQAEPGYAITECSPGFHGGLQGDLGWNLLQNRSVWCLISRFLDSQYPGPLAERVDTIRHLAMPGKQWGRPGFALQRTLRYGLQNTYKPKVDSQLSLHLTHTTDTQARCATLSRTSSTYKRKRLG